FDFTILSYNILADNLLWKHSYLYNLCPPEALQWDFRKEKIINELYQLNADIVCLQEVHDQHYHNYIKPMMKRKGYIGAYEKRFGNNFDGCATFFKKTKFNMVQRCRVDYHVNGVSLMDRDNIGLIVMLEYRNPTSNRRHGQSNHATEASGLSEPNLKLCIANTHLLYNPKRGDVKLAQLTKLFAEINNLTTSANCPVILCGDFNSTPTSALFQFISEGHLVYDGLNRKTLSGQRKSKVRYSDEYGDGFNLRRGALPPWGLKISNYCKYDSDCDIETHQNYDALFHHLNLRSVYRYLEDSVTTDSQAVDYIFYSTDAACNSTDVKNNQPQVSHRIQPINYLNLYSMEDMEKMQFLPNFQLASDHISLISKLRYFESKVE
ncbi:uncharacterized protein TRIADDRAFT_18427, partial [Trichoplax adhaerens]